MQLESWISPKTTKGLPSKIAGQGFFAKEPIAKGGVVAVKLGHVVDEATLNAHRQVIHDSEIQIAKGLYLAPLTNEEFPGSMVYINHSCEPNCGIGGNILMVAMRDIAAGEELTIDYSLLFADPNYSMRCNCQTQSCRSIITGNDWKMAELQRKYIGFYSWYIEQKIRSLASS